MDPVTVENSRGNRAQIPRPQARFDVSTVFVDNFVDKGILIPGKHRLQAWHRRKPGKNSKLFLFKINHLENAS
ncbi:hypothetical protein [Duganella vulcania]|uniref:Uncharacterized protein n=1 Tax=Duganella vulcania TaxID=2692166 RepID=A0A845GHU3_9BURK|nr:hypothetical protein [Duganella vulcania]MYM93864.1 hypothetical protein [Duganella vulcania]